MINDLSKTIIEITSSREYQAYNKYHEGNILGITGVTRTEHMHSNFIAWLLDSHSGHGLGDFPIKQFLGLLSIAKKRPENENARFGSKIKCIIDNFFMSYEEGISSSSERESNNIDVLLRVYFGGKILPIIIENKVGSSENGKQTQKYYDYAEKRFDDRKKYYEPLYVYLTPAYNKSKPSCSEYIMIRYQDVVDYVIEPALWKSTDTSTINNLSLYLQSLSHQKDFRKGENVMAISKEEREILENFYNNNKNLIVALAEMMSEDEDIDPKTSKVLTRTISNRDYSKYSFNNETYKKNRLVLAVIKKYVSDNSSVTFEKLEDIFPKDLQGSYGVFKRFSDLKQNEIEQKRFYVNDPIHLHDGTDIVVCTQWGVDNIVRFITNTTEKLSYSIVKL